MGLDLRSHIHEHCVLSDGRGCGLCTGSQLLASDVGYTVACLTRVLIKREIFFSDTVLFPKILEQSARGPGCSLFPLRDQLSAMVREWCLHPGIVGLIRRSSALVSIFLSQVPLAGNHKATHSCLPAQSTTSQPGVSVSLTPDTWTD